MYGKKLTFIQYWGIRSFFRLVNFFGNIILVLLYWGKGKTVPRVTNDLLLMSATQVAEKIRNGQVKSEDVVLAYIARINEVEPDINAVAENRFKEAIKEAKEIDNLIKSGKFTKQQLEEEKPLLGVPFTVKVLLNVKGLRNTSASVVFKDSPEATTDAPTVSQMKLAGAIVLATSNAAELGFGFESNNPLYGKTCNPYDTNRTAGGSSGGEAALIGAAASVIGLGNDVYGSVRVPAHFTGIYSHKPSRGLLVSNIECIPLPTAETSKFLEVGPMCRYVEDLVTMMKILPSNSSEKLAFGRQIDFKKLKIFYQLEIADPSLLPVDQEIKDAIKTAADHFSEKHGVIAKEVNIKLLAVTNIITLPLLLGDVKNIIGHVTDGKLNDINAILELGKFAFGKPKYSLFTILESSLGNHVCDKDRIPVCKSLLDKIKEKFENMLDENSVFFFPTLPFAAPRHFQMLPRICNAPYAGVFNFIGFPATQCPLGLNRAGMPQGMQIVARKNNDPLTLACAEELDKVFGGWISPS